MLFLCKIGSDVPILHKSVHGTIHLLFLLVPLFFRSPLVLRAVTIFFTDERLMPVESETSDSLAVSLEYKYLSTLDWSAGRDSLINSSDFLCNTNLGVNAKGMVTLTLLSVMWNAPLP